MGSLSSDLLVRDWTRQNRTWFAAVQLEKRMMFIILTLIVAVAAFNLVSTLVMTVTDKRADIAILRTLGASPGSIMLVFMVQGAMVGLVGTGAGLLLGLLVAFNIDTLVPLLEHSGRQLSAARHLFDQPHAQRSSGRRYPAGGCDCAGLGVYRHPLSKLEGQPGQAGTGLAL